MENAVIVPNKLSGKLVVPPSKSAAHRLLICAALAAGESTVENVDLSQDVCATVTAMRALGSRLEQRGEDFVCSGGVLRESSARTVIDCCESGSTLRFLIPIALAAGGEFLFRGRGRLLSRPLEPYFAICREKGIFFRQEENGILFRGRLTGGEYRLAGNVSSQFISGLLFALPQLERDSTILITTPPESVGYIDLTLAALAQFGIAVENRGYREFFIRGGQKYRPQNCRVEGDYSQAAFYLVANALGSSVQTEGLSPDSKQGDREILEIIAQMGLPLRAAEIDVSQIPDLVPILAVLATQAEGETRLMNAARLRMKESDRLQTTAQELRRMGADITELADELRIRGKTQLHGAVCDAHNDHRIAMALAIAATAADGEVTVLGADCVKKSYGKFWEDYSRLGGNVRG